MKVRLLIGAALGWSNMGSAFAQLPEFSTGVTLIVKNGDEAKREAYATFADAVAAAVEARRKNADAVLRLELVGGEVYRLTAPLALPREISGTQLAPTVITSTGKGKATISGARALSLNWKRFRDNVWVSDLDGPAIDQLWADGKRQIRARYPNYNPQVIPFGGYAEDALAPERVARWGNPTGGEVHAMQVARWGSVFFRIEGKNPDNNLVLGEPAGNNRVRAPENKSKIADNPYPAVPGENQPHKTQRYVENIFEELDAPGEWFFDASAKKLYYQPAVDIDPRKARFDASALEQLIVINGSRDAPVHDILLEGLEFTHTARTVLKSRETMLRSDWAIYRSGAITLEGAERIGVLNSDFRDLGGNAVVVSGYNRTIDVSGNLFDEIGGSAIHFVGRRDAVRSPVDQYADGLPTEKLDRTPGPKTEDYPAHSTARDNLITRVGVTDKQAAGIAIDIAQDIHVANNSIYDAPRAGINIGQGNFGGHVIEFNDVFDTVLETGDHGAFNSWGRDRYWHPDLKYMRARAAADPAMPFLDAVKPVILRNNRWRTDDGFDVDLDDGSSNYEIYNNVMLRGGLKLREGFRRIVRNNIIINNGLHPHVSFPKSGDVFRSNIVMGPYQPILVDQWDDDFDSNLFANAVALKDAQKLGGDADSKYGDPMFVDAAKGDYRVKPNSPALAIGFKNFAMNFGVESPRLRAIAKTPEFPELLSGSALAPGKTYDFSGAKVKSLETLGEQSATGAPDRTGALVLSVTAGSKAAAAGLQRGDLVRSVDLVGSELVVGDAPTLLVLQASHKWQGRLKINVLRGQKIVKLEVPYE